MNRQDTIQTSDLRSVNATTGEKTFRRLLAVKDRRGKRFFVDADSYADPARLILAAYKRDGSRLWVQGRWGYEGQHYHRDNFDVLP